MKISVVELQRLMDVPESYKIYSLNQKVITPIKNELKNYFKGLEIKSSKIKGKTAYYEFFFQKEKKIEQKNLTENHLKISCNKCNGGYLIEKLNKDFDISFLACDRFPLCKNTKNLNKVARNDSIKNKTKLSSMTPEQIEKLKNEFDSY